MEIIASVSAIFTSLLWLASGILGAQFGAMVFKSDLPKMEKINIFGSIFFAAQGVICTLYFLISLLPYDTVCYGMVACQLTNILDELDAQRWNYCIGAIITFSIALTHYRFIKPIDEKYDE